MVHVPGIEPVTTEPLIVTIPAGEALHVPAPAESQLTTVAVPLQVPNPYGFVHEITPVARLDEK